MSIKDKLARWEADEAAVRAKLQPDRGWVSPESVAGLDGTEFFARMFAGAIPAPPIGATLDFILIHTAPGHAVFQGRPLPRHYNPLGTVHGGWLATLLDSAVGCAVHTTLPAGRTYTTVDLKIHYVRALTAAVPLVRAEGHVIHAGRQVATSEGRLTGPDGKLYAHATTTCLIFDPPAARKHPA